MTFEQHLKKYLSDEQIEQLLASLEGKNTHAAILNTRKMSDEQFLKLFPLVKKHPIVAHAYIYEKEIYDLGKSIFYDLGCFYLQEPSAMIPSFLLSPNEDDIVLDLCAAPGGKTVQASFLMDGRGLIIANDIARDRTNILLENVEKLGLPNVAITNNDFQKIEKNYENYFTKIILDAPCSGSGMFRKMEAMKGDWSYNKVLKYAEVQKSLILSAYNMLAPGGTMVYSTCSFSMEENEEIVEYLLANTEAFEIEIEGRKEYFKPSKSAYGVHLFPSFFTGEGHYICLIGKAKNPQKTSKTEKNKRDFAYFSNSEHLFRYGDTKFFLEEKLLNKGLNIVRHGLKFSTIKGQDEIYDFHLSRALECFPNEILLQEEEMNKYLKGETVPVKCARGIVLLKYQSIPISFGKSDGSQIKNHYPKRLRKRN